MNDKQELRFVIVSDGTGETASLMTKAAVLQFSDREITYTRYKNVRTQAQVDAILQDAALKKQLVVYTLVSPALRDHLNSKAAELKVPAIDLLGPLLSALSMLFETQPQQTPGIFHAVNDRYFQRIAAMEYTIKHDDGQDMTNLDDADIIILGISRTSKTPLSMFLSHQGWKVCNVPLVNGIPLPKEIFQTDQSKIVGLNIQADVLHSIRKARLSRLSNDSTPQTDEQYASMNSVMADIDYATQIFKQNRRWPVFDVSGKALEETAAEITRLISARQKQAQKSKQNAE